MKRLLAGAAVLLLLIGLSTNTYAQSSNASVSGFVQDPSQAFIPGVTVTATNTQTGVVEGDHQRVRNVHDSQPAAGTYRLTAELPGFKTQVISDVQLGQSASARYNFTLQVGAAGGYRGSHGGSTRR